MSGKCLLRHLYAVIFFAALTSGNAYGFTPLPQCPYQSQESIDQLYRQYEKALKEKDALSIKIYLRLLQCAIGPARSDISEKYIARFFDKPVNLPMEMRKDILKTYWNIQQEKLHTLKNETGKRPESPHSLTYLSNFIEGAVRNRSVLPDEKADDIMHDAMKAGDRIVSVQQKVSRSVVPMPAPENKLLPDDYLFEGWMVEDAGDGKLYETNAKHGLSLLELHKTTGEEQYLLAARLSGEWARRQPLVLNFHYNGYNAMLLAALYKQTSHTPYLEDALEFARLGVMQGQYESGEDKGHWLFPASNRLENMALITRQLAALFDAMPKDHLYFEDVGESLSNAINAVEDKMIKNRGFQPNAEMYLLYCTLENLPEAKKVFLEDNAIIKNSLWVFAWSVLLNLPDKPKHWTDILRPDVTGCIFSL